MGSRADYQHATPAALQAMSGLERYVRSSGLEPSLLRAQFSEKELVDLTMAVITINGWNRLSISFGTEVGSYQRSPSAAAAR
jgi:alkylhydroperoxidase family enzyme